MESGDEKVPVGGGTEIHIARYDDLSIRLNGHRMDFVTDGSGNIERDGTARRVAGSNGGN
jgi:hypothetical protein